MILVVDDNRQNVFSLLQLLEMNGFTADAAYSGEEALTKLDGEIEPQLIVILSDINMPGMDGLTLLRRIKSRRPELPVMMVTAYGDEERRRLAGEYGAAEFVTKPVDFDLLKAQLRQLPSAAAD